VAILILLYTHKNWPWTVLSTWLPLGAATAFWNKIESAWFSQSRSHRNNLIYISIWGAFAIACFVRWTVESYDGSLSVACCIDSTFFGWGIGLLGSHSPGLHLVIDCFSCFHGKWTDFTKLQFWNGIQDSKTLSHRCNWPFARSKWWYKTVPVWIVRLDEQLRARHLRRWVRVFFVCLFFVVVFWREKWNWKKYNFNNGICTFL